MPITNPIGLPVYRIGPDDYFTGGDLKADAETLNGMMEATATVVDGTSNRESVIGSDLLQSWNSLYAAWFNYFQDTYKSSSGFDNFLTALNDGNRDQLIQYENRFADLHAQLKAKGVYSALADVAGSLGAPDTVTALLASLDAAAKKLLPFGLGLGAFLVIALVVWFIVIPRMAAHA